MDEQVRIVRERQDVDRVADLAGLLTDAVPQRSLAGKDELRLGPNAPRNGQDVIGTLGVDEPPKEQHDGAVCIEGKVAVQLSQAIRFGRRRSRWVSTKWAGASESQSVKTT